jgi:phage anti-repressor protein
MTTSVPEGFIDDLFEFYDENTLPTEFVIELEKMCKWLHVGKRAMMQLLRTKYARNVDYVVQKNSQPNNHNNAKYMLTPEAFKLICMMSRAKNGAMIRRYMIEVESMYIKYRQYIIDGMNKEMQALEKVRRPAQAPDGRGFIYIIRASETLDDVYKLGRTRDLQKRLRQYQTGRDADIRMLYKYQTDDIDFVEACVKKLLRGQQRAKYREVYRVNIDIMKALVSRCDAVQRMRTKYVANPEEASKSLRMKGGCYMVFGKPVAPKKMQAERHAAQNTRKSVPGDTVRRPEPSSDARRHREAPRTAVRRPEPPSGAQSHRLVPKTTARCQATPSGTQNHRRMPVNTGVYR